MGWEECGGHFHQRARGTQWSESEGGKGQAGPAGLTAQSSAEGKLPKVLGPLTEAQSKVVPGCTSQVPISCDSP